jgi:hypothetical protein
MANEDPNPAGITFGWVVLTLAAALLAGGGGGILASDIKGWRYQAVWAGLIMGAALFLFLLVGLGIKGARRWRAGRKPRRAAPVSLLTRSYVAMEQEMRKQVEEEAGNRSGKSSGIAKRVHDKGWACDWKAETVPSLRSEPRSPGRTNAFPG